MQGVGLDWGTGVFADDLERWGGATALVTEDGETVSYADLVRRADAFAARLGTARKVLYLDARNTVEAVAAYLGALRGRHPVILVAGSGPGLELRLCEAFQPEAAYHHDGTAWVLDDDVARDAPHPDLAVMLSTSGSTGSPKVVRLSRDAVEANARQIADVLAIAPGERAVTSLPMGYSYGLSVINSHLASGAAVVLTERSVTDRVFWEVFRAREATSFAGVPETYELLERLGFRDDPPPTLKTMTQAGGRMRAERVADYARWAGGRGLRFHPMYGQTEATARIAVVQPQDAARYADCVGQAVPGGELRLVDDRGRPINVSGIPGELVYRGPNVMMGYATCRADLARGAEVEELRTGDLAVLVDRRFFRIVGRNSRFSKIGGKRIALDDLEDLLNARGVTAVVAGDDDRLAIWPVSTGEAIAETRDFIARRCGVPAGAVVVLPVGESPRLASGKTDCPAILREAEQIQAAAIRAVDDGGGVAVSQAYALALGRSKVDPGATFTSLGGDSLAFVQVSIEIEERLGFLPDGWEHMKVGELDRLAGGGAPGQRGAFTTVSTDILLRALAIMAVVLGHTLSLMSIWHYLKGGLLILFMLAGYSLARLQRASLLAGRPHEVVENFLIRVILPFYVAMLALTSMSDQASLSLPTLLLFSNLAGEDRGPLAPFWFPEAMLQSLVLFCALFLIPSLRRFVGEKPFASAFMLMAGAMAVKVLTPLVWVAPRIDGLPRSPDAWAYVLTVGWAAACARTTPQRLLVLAATASFAAWDWGFLSSRHVFMTLGVGALMFLPRVTLPRPVAGGLFALATASFFIYLAHMPVIHLVEIEWGFAAWPVVFAGSIAIGVAGHRTWQLILQRLSAVVALVAPGDRAGRATDGVGNAL